MTSSRKKYLWQLGGVRGQSISTFAHAYAGLVLDMPVTPAFNKPWLVGIRVTSKFLLSSRTNCQ